MNNQIEMRTSLHDKSDSELLVMFDEYMNWARTKEIGPHIQEYADLLKKNYFYSSTKSIELALEFTMCECAIIWVKGLEK